MMRLILCFPYGSWWNYYQQKGKPSNIKRPREHPKTNTNLILKNHRKGKAKQASPKRKPNGKTKRKTHVIRSPVRQVQRLQERCAASDADAALQRSVAAANKVRTGTGGTGGPLWLLWASGWKSRGGFSFISFGQILAIFLWFLRRCSC